MTIPPGLGGREDGHDTGASFGPGSREPSPAVSAASGFDPSRWSGRILIRCMGGSSCDHPPGECTADPEYQAHIREAERGPERLEFRPDHKGRFDEIVARFADGLVHVETMSNKSCYVGFYWDDGRYCQWWISADKKLRYTHEDGKTKPPRFNAWGAEQNRPRDSDAAPRGREAAEAEGQQRDGEAGSPNPNRRDQ